MYGCLFYIKGPLVSLLEACLLLVPVKKINSNYFWIWGKASHLLAHRFLLTCVWMFVLYKRASGITVGSLFASGTCEKNRLKLFLDMG